MTAEATSVENPAMTESLFYCRSISRFVGDPIDVVSGANTDVATDLAQRGPIPFQWTRYYSSSRSKTHCSLGWGQSHYFDRTLFRDLDGMRYCDPFGDTVGFPSPAHTGAGAGGMVLSWSAAHSYLISQPGQPDQEFHFSARSDTARLSRLRQGQFNIDLRYDESGALCEIVDSRGRLIRVTSDSAGRILKLALVDPKNGDESVILLAYEYDRAGNLIRAMDAYKTTLSFAYDAENRMTRRTDRRGYSFHFKYDDEGRCVHSRGDDGLLEVFLDYEPDARTTFVRRSDGGQWIYAYDDNKSISQIIDPYGNATKFILDERGRSVREIDPNGNVTTLHYDWRGRHDYRIDPSGNVLPAKEADPNPADPLAYELPTTPLEWDFGHLIDPKTIRLSEANDPLLVQFPASVINSILGVSSVPDAASMSAAERSTTQELLYTDDFGRPLEQSGPSFTEKWKYDSNLNLIEHRDRDGSLYRSVYKSWNALSQSIDPLGNITSFDLTVQGLMARVTDPGGTVTEYGYDLRDQLAEVREMGRLVESYRRDPAGNIIEKTDASGRSLVAWEVGPGNLDKAQILGSGEKHLFVYNATGRLIKTQAPTGTVTFAYDDDGKLLSDQRDGMGVVHEFALKRLVATTYFEKFKVNYQTLKNGDLLVQDPSGAEHRFQFGPTGLVAKLLANGSRELCQFDAVGRCRRKIVMRDAEYSTIWMHGYGYSAAGDLLAVVDTRRGTTKYRHDAAHRLAEEVPPDGPRRLFELDHAGNLIRQPGLANVVIGEGNRLTEANGEAFDYNDRCNLCRRDGASGTVRYEYNDVDMLVRCDIKGEAWTANYDSLCRRVEKKWGGQTTTYYWDHFRLAAEVRYDGSCRLYVYADDTALAPFLFLEYTSLEAPPESGKRFYVFTNQAGAPIRVEDDAGQTVWSARIDPYGKAQVDAGSTIEVPLRFPGHYFDQETGLHYNRFRYYSPDLGRYLQSDPAGLAGGINAYAYPHKPLTIVDVDGLGAKRSGRQPKSKNPPPPQVGCNKPLDPGMTPEQVRAELEKKVTKLREDMEAAAKAGHTHVEAPDGSLLRVKPSMGPCLSAAYDTKTGKVYYGQNNGQRPTNLREPLQTRANEAARDNYLQHGMMEGYPEKGDTVTQPYGTRPRGGIPGSHAEVNAMDKAMRDRDQQRAENPDVPPPQPKDMVIYNQNTTGQTQEKGAGKPCCPDCKKITGAGQKDGPADVS
jgi:RHS repeat-associated protein